MQFHLSLLCRVSARQNLIDFLFLLTLTLCLYATRVNRKTINVDAMFCANLLQVFKQLSDQKPLTRSHSPVVFIANMLEQYLLRWE